MITHVSDHIDLAVDFLTKNQVVAIPTETVYGLAGNIFSEEAIVSIYETKQRPHYNPLIVHVADIEALQDLVTTIPDKARLLADRFWPGPMTLVLKKNASVPDRLTAGKDTVAVRIPNHPVTLKLLRALPFPIAAPSANPFNRISPTTAEHVYQYFNTKIPMILKGGPCKKGMESTIIGFEKNEPVIYRLGSLSIEDIENVVGPIPIKNKKEKTPDAPGMLKKHYAPITPSILVDNISDILSDYKNQTIGVLTFTDSIDAPQVTHQEVLSSQGDFKEASSRLYSALHRLDASGVDLILMERLPDRDLGRAINDRLERAASR